MLLQGPFEGRHLPNSTMIGVGLTMEGINQNNMIYEFMLENGWQPHPRNLTQWLAFAFTIFHYTVSGKKVPLYFRL